MAIEPWIMVALAANFAGYAVYLRALRRDLVEPNRASWLIWSAATGIEAATYGAVNPQAAQTIVPLVSAVACIAVTLGIWRRSSWSTPTPTELACIGAGVGALLLWLAFRDAFWAHMLVVAAVPVSFWPTWASAWSDPQRERSPAWGLWTIGDLATLFVAIGAHRGGGIGELAYLVVELAAHATVWGLVLRGSLRGGHARSGGDVAGRFHVGANHLGKAVFASVAIAGGSVLFPFTGRRCHAARVPRRLLGHSDRYVQVAADEYLGPSGRIDDLVNHSCDPNAGLRFDGDGIRLIALRPIAAGEEITWDYSTTLGPGDWQMVCQCRTPACRGLIGGFMALSAERRRWYRAQGVVAPYLADAPEPDVVMPVRLSVVS